MNLIEEAKQGNRVFRVEFPDGTRIIFRLLDWHRFRVYYELLQKGTIPAAVLEDAIYRESVLKHSDIEDMSKLRAGVVSTVSMVVMMMSGPATQDLFNPTLELCRSQVDTLDSQILMIICRAFPAYKPEEIEALPWSTVLMRLAQAERILMSKNPPELAEPISILSPDDAAKKKKSQSGKIDAGDLVQEGKDLNKEVNQRGPGPALQLTPEQMQQLEQLRKNRGR